MSKLVEQHAQGIDVAAGVDVQLVELGLLGAHVLDRADHRADFGEHRLLGQPLLRCLGHPKVDDLRHGAVVVLGHQHVGGLEIAVNDSLLMGVLDRVTDVLEQCQSLAKIQPMLVTVLRDRHTLDHFHHEIGSPRFRGSRVEDLGDVGMIHHRQCLSLGLKTGDHLTRVHARL